MVIPQRLLIASGDFGERLPAAAVAAAIARGVRAARSPAPDVCPVERGGRGPEEVREQLDALGFDARMRSARAVVVACERLEQHTLAGSVAFEIATRARQSGVPAYAVTAHDELEAFDARILDLQLILEARTARTLAAAGRTLAELA
jgi:glycerate kinase